MSAERKAHSKANVTFIMLDLISVRPLTCSNLLGGGGQNTKVYCEHILSTVTSCSLGVENKRDVTPDMDWRRC